MDRSPTFFLFHSWFGWRVPEMATLTDYAREDHGFFAHPDKDKASAILMNMKTVFMRPFEAAEYLTTGMALDINRPTEAIEIYKLIMEHLALWLNYVSSPQLISRDMPMQGLREFNNLANKLFPIAHRYGYYQKPEQTMSTMLQSLFNDESVMTTQKHRFNDTLIMQLENAYRRRGNR